MVISHILDSARARINSDQLVKDVIIHNALLEFELMQNIVCGLDVA